MTDFQKTLIEKLATEDNTAATFNGQWLNCVHVVKGANGKAKPQKFSFCFDDPADCQGSRLVWKSLKGGYSEVYAERAAKIIKAHSDEIARIEL